MNTEILNTELVSSIENYVFYMSLITILVGLNFAWLYLTTNSFVEKKRIFLILSIIYGALCFFSYNYFIITNTNPTQIIFFFLGFSSLLAILSLQFLSGATTKNTKWWNFMFSAHSIVIGISLIYFFFY